MTPSLEWPQCLTLTFLLTPALIEGSTVPEATWVEDADDEVFPKETGVRAHWGGVSALRSEPQLEGIAAMGLWNGMYQALLAVASEEASAEGVRCTHGEMLTVVKKALLENWHEGAVDEGMPLEELEGLATAVAEIVANTSTESSHPASRQMLPSEGIGIRLESDTTGIVYSVDTMRVVMSEVASSLEPAFQKESHEKHPYGHTSTVKVL